MNTVIFDGRVAAEPRKHNDGKVLNFPVAVDSKAYDSETGKWVKHADYFQAVMFGNRASAVSEFLRKGMPVTIQAHARSNKWTDPEGDVKYSIDFVVDDISVHR